MKRVVVFNDGPKYALKKLPSKQEQVEAARKRREGKEREGVAKKQTRGGAPRRQAEGKPVFPEHQGLTDLDKRVLEVVGLPNRSTPGDPSQTNQATVLQQSTTSTYQRENGFTELYDNSNL